MTVAAFPGRDPENPKSVGQTAAILGSARALRQIAFGCTAVIVPLYWQDEGLSLQFIGLLYTAALLASSTLSILTGRAMDRMGRRKLLVLASVLWFMASFLLYSASPVWLSVFALVGPLSPSGKEIGPFLAVEQAALARIYAGQTRVRAYAWLNLIGYTSAAVGALISSAFGLARGPAAAMTAFHWAIAGYAAVGLIQALLYSLLPPAVEAAGPYTLRRQTSRPPSPQVPDSRPSGPHVPDSRVRRLVHLLSGLFAMDAVGAGFIVQGLLVAWFRERFGLDLTQLGLLFFGTNLLSGLSSLWAARLSGRIGLLNTMVFTHLPSNILLILVPIMPTPWLAAGTLLLRHLLSQMDVPTRQAYTMAMVGPDDRAYMSAWTNGVRHFGTGSAPLFSGAMLALSASGLPFFIAGGLKTLYDLILFAIFRRVPLEHAHRR